MENIFLIAQIIGFCAMCFSVAAWQVKEPRKIYALYVPSSLLWSLQYCLLGAPVGAIISICSASKDAGLAFADPKHKKYFLCAYLLLIIIFGCYFYQSTISIFPIFAAFFLNITILLTDQRSFISRSTIISQFCFIYYNLHNDAWMAMLCSCFVILSSIIGMARHEKWVIGKCYKTFMPSIIKSLFFTPKSRALL